MHRGVVAALAAMFLGGCADKVELLKSEDTDPWAAYSRSIALAAVKSEASQRELTPIVEDEVVMAHLQGGDKTKIDTSGDVWVAFPAELRAHCIGKPNPLRALQMALGLPPLPDAGYKVFLFGVRRADLFRPCASDSSVATSRCDLKVDISISDPHRPFVLRQMMASYRTGKDSHPYPFTGMGWSYNWDPEAKTPMGVSEYVVRLNAPVMRERSMTPADFCSPRAS